ncbi:putative elongation factor ts [Hibiscus syriacus]|uniref:Transmembrane 9 superfamily member n=1 Tax=Hibiscus syriacus TaxID=106335 RepID=A0A6A2Z1Y9_HIBSY|nr:putative elongation factor ts [Hibiscus syriacus]
MGVISEVDQKKASGFEIVGFQVIPCSVKYDPEVMTKLHMYDYLSCELPLGARQVTDNKGTREDLFYLRAGIVFVIFLRTVGRDLTRYEELDKEAQAQMNEELSGWNFTRNATDRDDYSLIFSWVPLLAMLLYDSGELSRSLLKDGAKVLVQFPFLCILYSCLSGSAFLCLSLSWEDSWGPERNLSNILYGPTRSLGRFLHANILLGFSFLVPGPFRSEPCSSNSSSFLASGLAVSVILTYMHLCVEEWRWWWKAFFASGSVALYVFLYSINYLVFDLQSLSGPV